MQSLHSRWRTFIICLVLGSATVAAFFPVFRNDFVNYDDQDYVYENPVVLDGLTPASLKWAFTTLHGGNYHPLTWISHMADVTMHGLNAGGHHATSLIIHTGSAMLLFLALLQLIGAGNSPPGPIRTEAGETSNSGRGTSNVQAPRFASPDSRSFAAWSAFFVAALFALHPLRVESVAWVSERKDVLSGLFFMLTLWAYAKYVSLKPGIAPQPSVATQVSGLRSQAFYSVSLLCFTLGLMSKPMLVTLPFVLLLLDYWPLGRFANTPIKRLLVEKLPFFLLTAASSVLTLVAQSSAKAVASIDHISLESRVGNACVSYVRYLQKTFWPVDLAPMYPYEHDQSPFLVSFALLLLLAITGMAIRWFRSRPGFAVGWFWYLGMLVPVIGLVQVGQQAFADRYTYLPLIGVFLVIIHQLGGRTFLTALSGTSHGQGTAPQPNRAGSAAEPAPARPASGRHDSHPVSKNMGPVLAGFAILCVCGFLTHAQARRWRNSETLFRHTLEVTTNNAVAHESLGLALAKRGEMTNAIAHFSRAVEIDPYYAQAHTDLGLALVSIGEVERGISHYRTALDLKPDSDITRYNLGRALMLQDHAELALAEFETALKLNPDSVETRLELATALARLGKTDEAARRFEEVIGRAPQLAEARIRYARLLAQQQRPAEALEHFREALQLRPDAPALAEMAAALAAFGRPAEAIEQYRAALRLSPDSPLVLNNLAWLQATAPDDALRNGVEAVANAGRACELTGRKEPVLIGTLAAAYAEAGRFDDAVKTAQEARVLAESKGLKAVAEVNSRLIEDYYRRGRPFRESK